MADYKSMYFQLAAKVADVIELLILAQQQGEESAMEDGLPAVISVVDRAKQK